MIIFATDLDRTLLPNGPAEDDGNLPTLFEKLSYVPHILVYVTGRNLTLFEEAQKEFDIPTPDYLISDVGTRIYRKEGNTLVPDNRWIDYVSSREKAWSRERIVSAMGRVEHLTLQELSVQNRFKISYYVPPAVDKEAVLEDIRDALRRIHVIAKIVWSVDPLKGNTGLIDVLPNTATKETALEFIRTQKGLIEADVVYCGDSGNDILPLTRCYRSILVNNAREEVKNRVEHAVAASTCPNTLYIARGGHEWNGNYASGILEGLHHFGII